LSQLRGTCACGGTLIGSAGEPVPGGTWQARLSLASVVTIAGLVAAVTSGDPQVVRGDDLEEHTERLTMIADIIRYEHQEGSCPGSVMDEDGLVGFSKVVSADCFNLRAFETRASADVESLLDRGAKLVKSAQLTYEEAPVGRAGGWTATDSCVGRVLGLSGVEVVDGQPRTRSYESGRTEQAPRSGRSLVWSIHGSSDLLKTTGSCW